MPEIGSRKSRGKSHVHNLCPGMVIRFDAVHAQPIYSSFVNLFQEVCACCVIISGPRAASAGEKNAGNGKWAELLQNVPSMRALIPIVGFKQQETPIGDSHDSDDRLNIKQKKFGY